MTTAMTSATAIESQIPAIPSKTGISSTAATRNTSVLKNDITAEVTPSLRAVKKPEEI